MATDETCVIHYLSGSFIIFNTSDALKLRRKRIISQPVGGGMISSPQGPYYLSPYMACIVAENNLAVFKRLTLKTDISVDQNKADFSARVGAIIERESELFRVQRLQELEKRNITPTPTTLKHFDKSKLRLTVSSAPDGRYSSHDEITLTASEVMSLLVDLINDPQKMLVVKDMYKRGFYLNSGMRFGGDFLAYIGDPVLYHAHFVLRVVAPTPDGYVDLSKVDYNDFNGFQRLTHTANKIPLFAVVVGQDNCEKQSIDILSNVSVRYWTLGERQYLTTESKNTDLEPVDPDPSRTNKIRKS